jgi:hypothetical protein
MKVQAIRTENGNYIANYGEYFFFVGQNRKTLLRMSDQGEFEEAKETWGENVEPLHITEIKQIIELQALSVKTGYHIDVMFHLEMEELSAMQNHQEAFSYVNNNFNYVVGGYFGGTFHAFHGRCGGQGTSEYGNHGDRTLWEGESYTQTINRFAAEFGEYPELLICENSNHQSRQGDDGWKKETEAYILPSGKDIAAFFSSQVLARETMKKMVLIF